MRNTSTVTAAAEAFALVALVAGNAVLLGLAFTLFRHIRKRHVAPGDPRSPRWQRLVVLLALVAVPGLSAGITWALTSEGGWTFVAGIGAFVVTFLILLPIAVRLDAHYARSASA